MKPTRSPKPPPRTLAAAPPPSLRSPHASLTHSRFPSLVAVIAGGALVPACHAPECGDTRADELTAHGDASMRAARRGEGSAALREIAVALGLASHPRTQPTAGGSVPIATVIPPAPPPVPPAVIAQPVAPPSFTMGEPVPVGPAPVVAPPRRTPTPPAHPTVHQSPARGGAQRVIPRPPADPARIVGQLGLVGPLPAAPDPSATPPIEEPRHG